MTRDSEQQEDFVGPLSPVFIRSENDAIDLLSAALKDQLVLNNQILVFDGWPTVQASYVGEQFHSTINSDIAAAIVETQKAVNKAFVSLALHRDTSYNLTDHDRENLKFSVEVKEGSSLVSFDLDKAADTMVKTMVNNMSGTQVLL